MRCPACKIPFAVMERNGVEIDYCPKCLGVWFDRGEIDQVLDRLSLPFREESDGSFIRGSRLVARRRRGSRPASWVADLELA